MADFRSAIYSGTVRHRRFTPKHHTFKYSAFMMYLDLSEIETIFTKSPFWSIKKLAPVQFKRNDFHIAENDIGKKYLPNIDESIRKTVLQKAQLTLTGPIRMLVNLRYWGINMNPLSTYYCFADDGETLVAIVAEVHNTPWGERHSYVLTTEQFAKKQHVSFSKEFHVSPFNPIDMQYKWHSTTPNEQLAIHLENWQHNCKVMDATMTLAREEINSSSMNKILIRFPWMTVKVVGAIYWQAVKLWLKGIPIFDHPQASAATGNQLSLKNTNEANKL